jgi:hypothetical protein
MMAIVKLWSDDFNFMLGSLGSVTSLLTAIFNLENPDRKHKLWCLTNWAICILYAGAARTYYYILMEEWQWENWNNFFVMFRYQQIVTKF